MMVTGFVRVFTSVLLLLAMTTTFVHQAGAATSTSYTPSDGSASTTPSDGSASTTPSDGSAGTTPSDGSASTTPSDGSASTTPSDGSASTTSGTATECPTETAACQADATCAACSLIVDDNTEYDSCIDEVVSGDLELSTAFCVGAAAVPCCIDFVSDNECQDNAAFEEYFDCLLESEGCDLADYSCDDADGGVLATGGATAGIGSASTVLSFSCAFMVVLPLLRA